MLSTLIKHKIIITVTYLRYHVLKVLMYCHLIFYVMFHLFFCVMFPFWFLCLHVSLSLCLFPLTDGTI